MYFDTPYVFHSALSSDVPDTRGPLKKGWYTHSSDGSLDGPHSNARAAKEVLDRPDLKVGDRVRIRRLPSVAHPLHHVTGTIIEGEHSSMEDRKLMEFDDGVEIFKGSTMIRSWISSYDIP